MRYTESQASASSHLGVWFSQLLVPFPWLRCNWIDNNYDGEVFVIDKDNSDFLENAKVLEALYERLDTIKESKK